MELINIKTNKFQTPLTEELKESLPREVWEELIDLLTSVKFIQNLIAPEEVRGYAKDRPKEEDFYNDGRIKVDVTNPHILEDMDFFRERAIFFSKHGKYTHLIPNGNPKSEYAEFWREELRRWKDGLVRPSDGEWIPGSLYFYWNYVNIWLVEEVESQATNTRRKRRGERIRNFPKVWLGDYLFFHYFEQAMNEGRHIKVLKTRGCGVSFKMASVSPRNMYVYPGSGNSNYHLASDRGFLTGDKGIWGKILDNLDWIAEHTPLPKMRLVDKRQQVLELQLGYSDEYGVRKGLLSSVHGISLKDNPDKARGIRGKLIHYEEDGLFPHLEKAWGVNRKAVEDGDVNFGVMAALGCLTENNYVWTNNGDFKLIKDLKQDEGIIGFDIENGKPSKEKISYWQPPQEKECLRIELNSGRYIECSKDHPLLHSYLGYQTLSELPNVNGKRRRKSNKKVSFIEAQNLKVGQQLAIAEEIPIFNTKRMWNPRLIGWLIGDGSYGFDKTPVLSNCESEINSWIESNLNTTLERSYITKEGKIYKETRIKGICPELRKIGIYGQTKEKKKLPVNIHSYCKEDICEFIGGLFDTDGYISKKGRISFSTAYKSLALEVLFLLQKIGVHGKIRFIKPNFKNPKDKAGHYKLEIADKKSVLKFAKEIKLFPKEKQKRLDSFVEYYRNIKGLQTDIVKGIRFERIISIKNIGKKPVYNLTASTTNTYLGNGIITHNTGGVMGSSFEGSEKLFYSPLSFNIHGLPNVYDRNSHGETICGFFWGAYLNRNNCFDTATGEPDVVKALVEILLDRYEVKYNSTDLNAITQKKAEEPCIVGNTFISNYSIGSDEIVNFENKFSNGIKPVYEFKLESGRTLNCTKNHKIFNGEIYKSAEHFKVGEIVKLKPLIPNKEYQVINIKGKFNFDNYDIVINEEWGRFLGLYLGDGSFYNSTLRVDFDKRDVESYKWLEYFFYKYFGKCSIKTYDNKEMISLQVHSAELKELFKQMDLIEPWVGNKHGFKKKMLVPNYIMNSPRSVISEYLKGYFDADSGIYTGQKNIKIHCKQLENLKRIQYLLTAFDIFANIKTETKRNGGGRNYIGNSITLRSWEVDRFKLIGYISKYKQDLLDKWTSYTSKTPSDYDTDVFKSLTYISDQPVYDIQTEEHCYSANGIWVHNCTPQEAVMRTTGTIFPVADIKEYMEEIGPRKEAFFAEHHVGELVSTSNGDIIFKEDITKVPLRKYHLDGNMNKTGAVEIFEMPKRTAEGVIVRGRYLAGADTIDSDTGGSLFSMFVFDTFTKRIVAEYTGRPRLASEAYEISLRLVKFYNAELNYENNLKGLFTYYDNANALHYLCDTPQILRDMDLVKGPSTYGNAKKGTRANKEINSYGRLLYAEYLINPAYNQDNKLNLHTMRSWGALEETIYYNSDGNFDRISALGMLFILVADRVKRTQSLSSRESTPTSKLANDPFFTKHFKSKNAIDTDFENKNNSF